MRTFFGILRSRRLSESVVLSAINACQYSVSVLVWKIFGQLWLLRQRSSWPAFTSEILSCSTPQVCGDSAPGYWRSVCCVPDRDRKSTRLNSSHITISYAVFCLKKKKRKNRSV